VPRSNHLSLPAYTLIFLLLLPSVFWGQEVQENPTGLVIPDGTPVKLQMVRTISSARAQKDDRLDFVVVKDVTVGGFTIIQAGTLASGSVVGVKGKRLLGIGGNVVIRLDSVELITGDEVALRARKEIKGNSHSKFMVVEMIAMGLLYLPAAPAFLLSRGRDSTVLKGTEVTAYINGDSFVQTARLLGTKDSVSELREMINFLPSRTVDGQGREGDMLNLIFIAKGDDLEAAFERAGWVKTDRSKPAIFWHLLRQRKHYVKLPMSRLYVFGRAQTYSYALPDPASIVARRHHIRIWRTDYQVDGTPIWVGAATHDIAIQIEITKLRIGHRIDPQVDAERDFIAGNLADTRLVTYEDYLHCVDPVFKGQTTTGGTYYSDSRMLLVDLHQLKSDNFAGQLDTSNFKRNTGGGAVLINASR
jgi:hypothetical protein